MQQERLIYPAQVFSHNWSEGGKHTEEGRMVSYSLYEKAVVGNTYTSVAGFPGHGHQTIKITRKDETGAYGFVIEDTIYVDEE